MALAEHETPLRAVVIGGGSGSQVSLAACLELGLETSAVVAMADDGGSTGLLREEADVTPPGDIRKCLVALAADPEDPLVQAFRLRFDFEQNHALGNLVLVGLEQTTGDFTQAIALCEGLLHTRGHVYPSTLTHVRMMAVDRAGKTLEGQVACCHADTALSRVSLVADQPIAPYQPALDAIAQADLIVLGPGSLYTSVISNLAVPGMAEAVAKSPAVKVAFSSVVDVQGETRGLAVADYLQALSDHGLAGNVDYLLVHDPAAVPDGVQEGLTVPTYDAAEAQRVASLGATAIVRDFCDHESPSRHDPQVLTEVFREVLDRCRSPKR